MRGVILTGLLVVPVLYPVLCAPPRGHDGIWLAFVCLEKGKRTSRW